jgi:hypothetical protein
LAFALLAGLTLATPPATRAQGIVDTKESWIISNRGNAKFEQIYGEPQNVSLEALCEERELTTHGAIRTRGILVAGPRPRPQGSSPGQTNPPSGPGATASGGSQGSSVGATTEKRRYSLTLPTDRPLPQQNCALPITPGLVAQQGFDFEADRLNFHEIEVVGTFEAAVGKDNPGGDVSAASGGFWFWAYSLGPAKPSQAGRTGLLALEDLVARPDRLAGEMVKVVGQFRGKNLFGDLDGADEPSDGWVIKDGAFAVWVVGKKPKGSGWSLDPTSRGDTVRWVQVTGTLDRKGKVTRIKAMDVALVPPPSAAAPDP